MLESVEEGVGENKQNKEGVGEKIDRREQNDIPKRRRGTKQAIAAYYQPNAIDGEEDTKERDQTVPDGVEHPESKLTPVKGEIQLPLSIELCRSKKKEKGKRRRKGKNELRI